MYNHSVQPITVSVKRFLYWDGVHIEDTKMMVFMTFQPTPTTFQCQSPTNIYRLYQTLMNQARYFTTCLLQLFVACQVYLETLYKIFIWQISMIHVLLIRIHNQILIALIIRDRNYPIAKPSPAKLSCV